MINVIFSIPAATSPDDVAEVFSDYYVEIPPSGVMPASTTDGGKHLVNCVVSGASYQDILDVTTQQRPIWQIFGCIDLLQSPNPDYDPEDDQSEPMITVVHKPLNNSVWNFLPDNKNFDENGDPLSDTPQTELHTFQGCAKWPSKLE